jgi:Protein of unknown function (DUF2490)
MDPIVQHTSGQVNNNGRRRNPRCLLPMSDSQLRAVIFTLLCSLLLKQATAQYPTKQVNQNMHTWASVNATMHFSQRWGAIADFHVRRTSGVNDPSFYFVRFGANYWVKEKFTLAAGYAHMWLPPAQPGWKNYSNENRIYQQALAISSMGKTGLVLRLRNEQRWHQKMKNDSFTGNWRFTDRVRFLTSFTFPVSKKPGKLSIVLADEILVQMGKEIVYNFFDQNRIFAGIRHNINKDWSFDFGYMNVYQQKSSGYQYDMNHTIRWFFYYNPDFRKHKAAHKQVIDSREE